MITAAEITDIMGPEGANPGSTVNVSVIIRNYGDSPSYFYVSGSYIDGALRQDARVTPTSLSLDPEALASFTNSFTMPNNDIEFLAQLWHGDGQNRINVDSKKIHIKVITSSTGGINGHSSSSKAETRNSSTTTTADKQRSDFLQQERDILQAFRHYDSLRSQAKTEAIESRQRQQKDNTERRDSIIKRATAELNDAKKAMSKIEYMLTSIGLINMLQQAMSTIQPRPTSVIVDEMVSQLAHSSSEAVKIASKIETAAKETANWRLAQHEHSRLTTAGWFLLFSFLAFFSILPGIMRQEEVLLIPGLVLPPIFLAIADSIWNLGKKEPGKSFSGGYLALLFVAPVAPLMALYWIFHLPANGSAIRKRYEPMRPERKARRELRSVLPGLVQALADAELQHNIISYTTNQYYDQRENQIEAEYQQKVASAKSVYDASWGRLYQESQAVHTNLGLIGAQWSDNLWKSWKPPSEEVLSPYLRFGKLAERGQWHQILLPALVPLIGKGNLVIKCSGSAKDKAVEIVRCLMARLLAMVPPGKLRFILMDPVGLGQSMAAFMDLADYDETLVGGKIWTESQHIEEQLARLTEHMEFVIQKFLRDKYMTIEDYNREAGEVAEPYRVLVVVNFPVNFSESATRRLVSIALNGPRCGVYTIVTMDTEQELPYGFHSVGIDEDVGKHVMPNRKRKRREWHGDKEGHHDEDEDEDEYEDENETEYEDD